MSTMLTKALAFVLLLSHIFCCEGFEFTFTGETRQTCGMLKCAESVSRSPSDSRELAGLTIYTRNGPGARKNENWELLATVTKLSPKLNVSSEERHISGELSATKGELNVELLKTEGCESSTAQYSCVALLVDSSGRTTLMKSVLGGKIGADSDPSLECAGSGSLQASTNPSSASKESGAVEKMEQLVTSLWEKLKCMETRLEDFREADNRLEEKVDSLKTTVVEKIHDLERTMSDKLVTAEMRAGDKMAKLKERLEDKLYELCRGKSPDMIKMKTTDNLCLNNTVLLGGVMESVQFIKDNFTDLSNHMNGLEAAVTDSASKAAAVDSKLGKLIASVNSTSVTTNKLLRNVDSLSETCLVNTPAQVDEYFDALGTGRKEWRLAFRGTAYNNVEVYPAYIHGTGIPSEVEAGCKQFNHSLPCANHYRNRKALEDWANIDEVLFAIYVKGQMVKRIIFNGRDSTFTNWFSGNRVVESSWSDLTSLPHNIFSIEGDTRSTLLRRFLVNHLYNGCPGDKGWFMAGDALPGGCPFEVKLARPMFLYSKLPGVALLSSPQQVARADSIGVYIKYR